MKDNSSVDTARLIKRINDGFDPYKELGIQNNIFATERAIANATAKKEPSNDTRDAEIILKNANLKEIADKKLGYDKKREQIAVPQAFNVAGSSLNAKIQEKNNHIKRIESAEKDYNKILGVNENASIQDKINAYENLKTLFKDDKIRGPKISKLVVEAYRELVPEEIRTRRSLEASQKNSSPNNQTPTVKKGTQEYTR